MSYGYFKEHFGRLGGEKLLLVEPGGLEPPTSALQIKGHRSSRVISPVASMLHYRPLEIERPLVPQHALCVAQKRRCLAENSVDARARRLGLWGLGGHWAIRVMVSTGLGAALLVEGHSL